ncbi:MAG: integrase, partial [Candidatus Pacebacteria bacterium]|nr:integrase [Candidatus Paceibacterota bacterium]
KNGSPLSIYLDKFSTYKVNHKNATDNKDMITQFQRASNQMGFKLIFANSPQAKGRVERMNQTLQDRLVKELKLENITTIEKANEFLKEYIPKFNKKFAVVPQRQANLHKEINATLKQKLPQIFSIQNQRMVMNDYTIRFENQYLQLSQEQPTTVYKKDVVIIEKHLDNAIKINLKQQAEYVK